jgi:hypothetical protein
MPEVVTGCEKMTENEKWKVKKPFHKTETWFEPAPEELWDTFYFFLGLIRSSHMRQNGIYHHVLESRMLKGTL